MGSALHWHGYGPWTGSGQELRQAEGSLQRNPGSKPEDMHTFLSSTMPPMQVGHFLLRTRATARERTWTDVDAALAWLAEHYRKYPPVHLPGEGYTDVGLDARMAHSRDGLAHGADAYWEYYIAGFSKVAYGVICCPHAHKTEIPCPLPPS